jgi:aspartate/methionine/tyrosine aminotransferase
VSETEKSAPVRDELRFPYMVYAHEQAAASSWCLSQSGMPVPDASFLAQAGGIDIAPPAMEALPAFEGAIARLFGLEPERVLATVGASSAMNFCAARYFRSGARVVCESPSYEPVRVLPEFFGAETRVLERRPEDGWELDPERVARELAGAEVGHVFLTNPNNPTGVLMEAERIAALAEVAAAHGGLLIVCEVYGEYLPPERRVHAALLAPNAISIGSLTKAYGLGALRAGWMLLGKGLQREQVHLRDMSYLTYVDPPTASLRGALAALEALPQLLQPLRQVEHDCRPLFCDWLANTAGVDCVIPEFGIFAFPRLVGIENTSSFCGFLAQELQVDVAPGEYFGKAGHVRVGCGVPRETLLEALERLERGLEAWRSAGGR